MHVQATKESGFNKALSRLTSAGGVPAQAARKADQIIGRATRTEGPPDTFGSLTNHGESRIPHCFKYDLGAGYRLVTQQPGDGGFWLLTVGKHEDCDRWIDSNRGLAPIIDKKSGRIAIVHHVSAADLPAMPWRPVARPDEPLLASLHESHVSVLRLRSGPAWDKIVQLQRDCDDDEILDTIDEIRDETQQEFVLNVLHALRYRAADSAANLFAFARGEAVETVAAPRLLERAVADGRNSDVVVALNDLSEEVRAHLLTLGNFDEWLLFLHPDQRRFVHESFAGPVLMRGVSGSGKTCVLLHRARALAEANPGRRIAVVTLNPSLARLLSDLLGKLCPPSLARRVDVWSVPQLCAMALQQVDPSFVVSQTSALTGDGVDALFEQWFEDEQTQSLLKPIIRSLSDTHGIDPKAYIREEMSWIRSSFARSDASGTSLVLRETYQGQTPRRGRAIPFSPDWRTKMLASVGRYERFLATHQVTDDEELVLRVACESRPMVGTALDYRAILVDEYQDLGTLELHFISRLVRPEPDALYLTGDLRQQISPKDLSLAAAGLPKLERRYFRRNYRNTRQHLAAAAAMIRLHDQMGDEPAGDRLELLDPEFSERESAPPLAVQADDDADSLRFAAAYVRAQDEATRIVCIVDCRVREHDEAGLENVRQQLEDLGVDAELLARSAGLGQASVYVSALEGCKGFEFQTVILLHCDSRSMPTRGAPTDERWRDARRLYVAMTRARDDIVLLYHGEPSPFIKAVGELIAWTTVEEQGLELDGQPSGQTVAAGVPNADEVWDPIAPDPTSERPGTGTMLVRADPEVTLPDLSQPIALLRQLSRNAGLRVVDKTYNGGALWVADGDAAREWIEKLRTAGIGFSFAQRSRALGGPGWWIGAESAEAAVRRFVQAPGTATPG